MKTHLQTTKWLLVLFCTILCTFSALGAEPEVLFHETFGDNSSSARVWNDSYSVKSGVSAVYSNVSYSVSNFKQSKNNDACTKSGLNGTQNTDATFEFGPLDVSNYTDISLSFMYKAGSIKGTYTRKAYYKISSTSSWTELTISGTMGTTCNEQSANLPENANNISTLYIKIVANTSNAIPRIDEVEITGIESPSCTPLGTIKGSLMVTFPLLGIARKQLLHLHNRMV